jgi:membrane protease YdiL (CAAX protease family)
VSARTIVGLIVAIAAADIVTTRLTPDGWDAPIKAAIIVAFLAWARGFAGLSWDELGFGRAHVRSGLVIGTVAALLVAAVIVILVAVPFSRGYFQDHDIERASTATRIFEPLVSIPLGTALFEETIFRGVLLGALLRTGTRLRAAIITSIVFGFWHIPPALSDAHGKSVIAAIGVVLGTMAVTSVAGLLFAYLRLRSGSVIAPIFGHIATDSFAYVAAIVALQL